MTVTRFVYLYVLVCQCRLCESSDSSVLLKLEIKPVPMVFASLVPRPSHPSISSDKCLGEKAWVQS